MKNAEIVRGQAMNYR